MTKAAYSDAQHYDPFKDEWAEHPDPPSFAEFFTERLRTEALLAQTVLSVPPVEAGVASDLRPHATPAHGPHAKAA